MIQGSGERSGFGLRSEQLIRRRSESAALTVPAGRQRPGLVRRLRANVKGCSGLAVLVSLGLAILIGPSLLGTDPFLQDLQARLAPPLGSERADPAHPLGTDALGRDVLARILLGGRVSMFVGLLASLLAAILGVGAGLVAGYAGRKWDGVITAVADVQLTFPSILLALAVIVMLGPGLVNLVAVLAMSSWVFQARIIRAEVLALKHRDFVEAGRAIGLRDSYLLLRYILPNVFGSVLVLFTLTVVRTILAESSLSFLGMGPATTPSWGGMVAEGRQYLATAWWVGTFPGLALTVTIIAINLIGDSLRDMLDPRIQQQGN